MVADFTTASRGIFEADGFCGHRRFDMGRARPNAAKPSAGTQSDASTESIGKDSDLEFCLLEIVRALACAAAREDHRKALEAEAMSLPKADRR
jgi:hypothetical protein